MNTTKLDLYNRGVRVSRLFLKLNRIGPVAYGTFESKGKAWNLYGFYRDAKIHVNVKKSLVPVKTPGFSWTYPGYKADLTAYGIVAHETGHYIADYQQMGFSRKMGTCLIGSEPPVSSYAPNEDEDFAEAIKLFITNPDLLQCGRPERYHYLVDALGLVPIVERPWREVLSKAHPRLIAAAENWCC